MSADDVPFKPEGHISHTEIAAKVKTVLAELLEIDPTDIEDSTRLADDLGADSLLYLELFEELKDEFALDIDLHEIGKYATKHPVSTVGELNELVRLYLEKGDALLKELEKEAADSSQ